MVAVGLTDCVPPLASRVYELPSVPDTVTLMAFVAVTVKMETDPEAIEAGLAVMVTVVAEADATVTVAGAETFPPAPVAVAVYVVVAVGLTVCVPPLGFRVYVLPSLPVIVT